MVERPRSGRQVMAARALADLTQEALAEMAGLHVNSVRYVERQPLITTGHSAKRVAEAFASVGVFFVNHPDCGVTRTADARSNDGARSNADLSAADNYNRV
jgi:hypothetical protein